MNAITSNEAETRVFDGLSATEKRALDLLAGGCTQVQVASATGLSESRISQIVSNPEVAAKISGARIEKLGAANTRDAAYDALEDSLIEKMAESLPFAQKPLEIARLLKVVNEAKRRGIANTEQTSSTTNVVQLLMPTTIVQKFTTNINNQVISTGDQVLETIQSNTLLRTTKELLEARRVVAAQIGAPENVQTTISENLGISIPSLPGT